MTRRTLALIDGNSLLYRAFFALPTSLTTSDGRVTNAVYGFTSMLLRLLREEKPDAVAVAFDLPGKTFRHTAYEDYKAHRPQTPDELISQMPLARRVLDALDIPVLDVEGFEADDVLGTLARRAAAAGDDVIVVTGDRDAFQLVDEHVKVMTTRKGISDIVVYDRQGVLDRYGVAPEQVADFIGLKGDSSDNIPGVPGVGEKTAADLLARFGSMNDLYERLDEVESVKLREKLMAAKDDALLSRHLATIDTDAPVDAEPDSFAVGGWDLERVEEVFRDLQFNSLLERFLAEQASEGERADLQAGAVADVSGVAETADSHTIGGFVLEAERLAVAVAVGHDAGALAFEEEGEWAALALADGARTLVCTDPEAVGVARAAVAARLTGSSSDAAVRGPDGPGPGAKAGSGGRAPLTLVGHDLKGTWRDEVASMPAGADAAALFDTAIAAYLLDSNRSDHPLDGLAWDVLGYRLPGAEAVGGAERAAAEARAAFDVAAVLEERLTADGLGALMSDVEMPLVPVLARMEAAGVGIDCDRLRGFGDELGAEMSGLEAAIHEVAGGPFNLNSPKQLGEVLFERHGLPKGKKTKTGYSTDASVLASLAREYPVVADILRYRELAKLKSTYVDALPRLVDEAGRIHTQFRQTVAATGRLSSVNPNLQNIPVRTDLGVRIRHAFVPANAGDLLMVADYSQIELRILAHLSGDEALIAAFEGGLDIHTATAAEVFGVEPSDVTPEQRRKAKAVNFGLVYGQSAHGLAESLGISRDEAQSYITLYFSRYPGVSDYIQGVIGKAVRDGYVTTVLGRRRYVPELGSSNFQLRSLGERLAVNSPIQGSAADVIKSAMTAIDRRLAREGLRTRMVLQVHDELVFEVPPDEREAAAELVKAEMEGAWAGRVPLDVDLGFGADWGDAK